MKTLRDLTVTLVALILLWLVFAPVIRFLIPGAWL